MNPSPKEVQAALQKYSGAPQLRGWLSRITESKECFCIEGVFCNVSIELGSSGCFIRKGNGNSLKCFVSGEYKSITAAPDFVFDHLSLPRTVTKEEILAAKCGKDVIETIKKNAPIVSAHRDRFSWSWLNDEAEVSLRDLIFVACSVLEKLPEGVHNSKGS
jgi:hypothetical protein